jgi:hypothetical protein
MTANSTPSRRVSMAAAVATFAAVSLVRGTCIEPEQSTMITSAAPPVAVAGPVGAPVAVTVTIAFTSVAPAERYSFW